MNDEAATQQSKQEDSLPGASQVAGFHGNEVKRLLEHIIDRDGLVWRVVRDGGMATRADYTGIESIGIETLRTTRGPLRTFDDAFAAERRATVERIRERLPYPSDNVTYSEYVGRIYAILDEEDAR